MRSLKSVLVLIFSLAPLASSGSAASIQTIADLFTGEFDNNLQSLLTEKTDLPFQRLHYIHTQLNQEDSKNSEVEVYVEQSIAKSSYVYRQRIYKFIYNVKLFILYYWIILWLFKKKRLFRSSPKRQKASGNRKSECIR